jgi:predicted DsbA family dithiol-disulfide isomerase
MQYLPIKITFVVDFMCPWSYIALKSLDLALRQHKEFHDNVQIHQMIPFEFDTPGTYPKEGTDWTEYCKSYGPQRSKFLLEEKLPRAFRLGHDVGINFSINRRIVHTEKVNAALMLVQADMHDSAGGTTGEQSERSSTVRDNRKFRLLDFSLKVLHEHFENLKDPNDERTLKPILSALGIESQRIDRLYLDLDSSERNMAWTQQARELGAPPVPLLIIRCGDSEENICLRFNNEGPTSPDYFVNVFRECLWKYNDADKSDLTSEMKRLTKSEDL